MGDRKAEIAKAIERLRELHEGELDQFLEASVIETKPVGCPPGTPSFLNTVIELQSSREPFAILDFCQGIERKAGRAEKRKKNSPRTIDVDILYIGELILETDRLTLPHPEMERRPFVLGPLSEIRSDRDWTAQEFE